MLIERIPFKRFITTYLIVFLIPAILIVICVQIFFVEALTNTTAKNIIAKYSYSG